MAISDQISRLQSSKSSIKSSIEGKGVSVPADAKLDVYNTYIDQIKTQGLYESKQVTPTAEGSIVLPSEGYDALSQVIIDGDMNLAPANIKKDVNIFGVTGTLEAKANLQTKQVTPTASGTTVTADEGYDGLSEVNVLGDSNLISSNIKKDVSIFGVNGSYEGSGGGSTDYNVYVQNSEPTSKNGVWIKDSSAFSGAKFFDYATATGEFLEASNFDFLKTGEVDVGQEIVDNMMYIFAKNGTSSYRVNLSTKVKTSISVPAISSTVVGLGTCVYQNKIYVFASDNSSKTYFYVYDPATDTNSGLKQAGNYISGIDGLGCYAFEGKIYVVGGSHNDMYYNVFNIETQKFENNSHLTWLSRVYGMSQISGCGQYIYYVYGSASGRYPFIQFDITTKKRTTLLNDIGNMSVPYATTDYIYFFIPSSSGASFYYKYDLSTNTIETIPTQNKYYLGSGVYQVSDVVNSLMLNTQNGILYFRTSGGNVSSSGMQFTPSPETEALANNTVAVVQSNYKNSIKIEDNSNLHISIDNVYLKTENGLESKTTFLGDGTQWNLFKNPTGETATVTFNTNGGSTIPSEQVVIGQKISAPSTPSKAGYVFDDWYLNGEPFDFSRPITEDITLVAGWETYEVIDYIESSGTQYIDTGVVPNSKTKVETKMAWTSGGSSQVNGWGSSGSAESFFWGVNSNEKFVVSVSSNYTSVETETSFDNKPHVFLLENGAQAFDGELIGTDTIGDTAEAGQTMYLFGLHGEWQATGMTSACSARMYYCKIYDNGVLVRNFVPIKTEKGAVGLLDQVNNVAYYNVGTGTFEVPDDINNYTQLEYIESTGTQYILTNNVYPQNGDKLEIEAYLRYSSFSDLNNRTSFGIWDNNGATIGFQFGVASTSDTSPIFNGYYADNWSSITSIGASLNVGWHKIELTNTAIKIDNSSYSISTPSSFTFSSNALALGGFPIIGCAYLSWSGLDKKKCIYKSIKWYKNSNLIYDFIPVKRNADNEIGLFDKVGKKFYTNAGTGTFIAGNGV